MQGLKSCGPCQELRPYVRAYAQRWTDVSDAALLQPLTAQAEQVVHFEFGKPAEISYLDGTQYVSSVHEVIGAYTREPHRALAYQLKLYGGTESFAIFFQPAGFSQLFAVPMHELTNRNYDATSVAGHGIRILWNKLGENPGFENRVRIVEQFLLQRASRAPTYEKIGSIANYILRQRGAIRMTDLASRSDLGLRQLERNFLRQVGSSPKVFARVARFQCALDAKVSNPKLTWLEIAHKFGYHDQMHMIYDFEKLAGNSPGELLVQLGDMRPPALASAET